MTRTRAEKLLTAALCGRGNDARDVMAKARALNPGVSNADALQHALAVAWKEMNKTIVLMHLDAISAGVHYMSLGLDCEAAISDVKCQYAQVIAVRKGITATMERIKEY